MKKFLIIATIFFLSGLVSTIFFLGKDDFASEIVKKAQNEGGTNIDTKEVKDILQEEIDYHIIPVPYVSEAPEGNWSGDWVNACEEAVLAMVEGFYAGKKSVSVLEAKTTLQKLFDEENILYGNNKNTDASQILELINLFMNFNGRIVLNPTLNEIKKEILEGRPVISLHRGFDLKNKNIPFSPVKSSYHTLVLIGFDDVKKEFITHDPGDEFEGERHIYTYDIILNSMHDYNAKTDKTDGVPTVIFTSKR